MKPESKKQKSSKKRLLNGSNHQLLSIVEVLNTVLIESDNPPAEVKQAIMTARDIAFKKHVEELEKVHSSIH